LFRQIVKIPLNASIVAKPAKIDPKAQYKDTDPLLIEMNESGWKYFQKIMVRNNDSITKENLKEKLHQWEEWIDKDHSAFVSVFCPEKMDLYENYLEDFKNKVFANKLWTVNSALKTPDPDLARYKKHFRDASNKEIFDTVNRVLNETDKYFINIAPKINYNHLKDIAELQMDYLNEDNMFMNKIIGPGIRSEILNRYFPSCFPIMTQPSMWAMFFVCETANEFITLDKRGKEGKVRVSHNWQYPYNRFTFLMNALFNMLSQWVGKYGFSLRPHLRFGYVNKFLSSIHDLHKGDIKLLHEWVDAE